jgi:hypothetical protein
MSKARVGFTRAHSRHRLPQRTLGHELRRRLFLLVVIDGVRGATGGSPSSAIEHGVEEMARPSAAGHPLLLLVPPSKPGTLALDSAMAARSTST